jgi:5'-phosphate synthase pdxT subunit
LREEGLDKAIRKFASDQRPIFGTCAGAILLASDVRNPSQASLGLLDMTVLRNGYGRQVHSDVVAGNTTLHDEPLEMVFIRAPVIERIGKGVEVLAEFANKPTLVQKGNLMAAAFHPELTADTTVHRRFLEMAKSAGRSNGHASRPTSQKTGRKPAKPKRRH